ncbi:MAG: hypothetical protein AB7S26_36525 [Sandaracinaceae bacterium]
MNVSLSTRWIAFAPALALVSGCVQELGPCDYDMATRVVYEVGPIEGSDGFTGPGTPAFEGQAMMIASCGGGAFCHAPDTTMISDRFGVPHGLDYDLRIAEDNEETTARLQSNQAFAFADRYRIWVEVSSGRMPVPGEAGEMVLSAAPTYSRYDEATEEILPLPRIATEEGREILRNWLACRLPVVERAESPTMVDSESFGATVSARDLAPLMPNWDDIFDRLVEPRCATAPCHGSGAAGTPPTGAGLDLRDRDEALMAMMNQPTAASNTGNCVNSTEMTDECDCDGAGMLIAPGDPDASIFLQKLEGHDAGGMPVCGEPMPVSGSRPSTRSLENIAAWITAGAMP